jgi:protein-tyrosine phosphatase
MATMKILFVCMGNICRSPTAQGVFMRVLRERAPDLSVEVDSAGTHGYHVGEPPDRRAIDAAARRGIDISSLRARRVARSDFERFDMILAMDRENRQALLQASPGEYRSRVRLLLEFADLAEEIQDVPDPYYGGELGFERVLDLVESAAEGLLRELLAMRPR